MVINTNINAINATRNLNESQALLSRSLARLSSGSKIVKPSDDAAGLAVSEKLAAQNARINAARTNTQNAMSYVQTADGFMRSMNKLLTRMSELTAMAKDVTKNSSDIELYDAEFQALKQQLVDTVGDGVTTPLGSFNGISLFGPNAGGLAVTIGESPDQTMTIGEINLRDVATSLGQLMASGSDVTNAGDIVVGSIQQVATERATLGSAQSRLEVAAAQLQVQFENLEAAISRIRDVDVAEEATAMAKAQILVQSGTSMLSQANSVPQTVLKLLQ
ncbi:flagellin [Opitutales bacterium ASA1]|jgi:flagellin|uniref:flagellin n=1 Tax=Congregicoccus parvus TaxID=3081749 RepID=UPI002B29141D|nr:flagellin [Opitutales bacterium ASA1]